MGGTHIWLTPPRVVTFPVGGGWVWVWMGVWTGVWVWVWWYSRLVDTSGTVTCPVGGGVGGSVDAGWVVLTFG